MFIVREAPCAHVDTCKHPFILCIGSHAYPHTHSLRGFIQMKVSLAQLLIRVQRSVDSRQQQTFILLLSLDELFDTLLSSAVNIHVKNFYPACQYNGTHNPLCFFFVFFMTSFSLSPPLLWTYLQPFPRFLLEISHLLSLHSPFFLLLASCCKVPLPPLTPSALLKQFYLLLSLPTSLSA